MAVLRTSVDPSSESYRANRDAQLAVLAQLDEQLALAAAGGGERYTQRHRHRGRLPVRERLQLLLDPDSPFLELAALAAWGTEFTVGASLVTGIGVVSGVECVLIGHDPTVRGGAMNPFSLRKTLRALEIARTNRLPVINLVESGGADLPTQADLFVPAGRIFHELTELSAMAIPTVALVFGNCTAGGAYVPGMCDYSVLVDQQAKVFLGGPPLVKMATGEDADDEALGGAEMHSRVSGLSDHFAVDERDAIRIGREIMSRINWHKLGAAPAANPAPPRYDPEEILGIVSADVKVPFDPREILARTVDGSEFDEYKPLYGTSLVTGWARIHGYPVGVLANHRGVLFSEEAKKASEFILLANQTDTPLVFLQNTTGYMVGTSYEQGGIIKDGAKMINAVTNSTVPHLTINTASSFGAGNYGMSGRAYDPRLMFAWPGAKLAVMGAAQLAGVLSIVANVTELDEAVASARREAASAFGDGTVFLERFVVDPRHVEVQIIGDAHGAVVHLFERDCSIQRRYQKIVEEAPSPAVDEALRAELGAAAVAAGKALGYVGAGTVEFILEQAGRNPGAQASRAFHFLEVNTRLQVEHPVTELVTGWDLVELQLRVAEGEPLPADILNVGIHGHAIEARLYAEDVGAGFLPATGTLHRFAVPPAPGIRIDTGVADGSVVGTSYDPMLAKVIAHGATRTDAARRLAAALHGARLHGVTTNRDLLVRILREPDFLAGRTDTGYLGRHPELAAGAENSTVALHAAAAALAQQAGNRAAAPVLGTLPSGWRNVAAPPQRVGYSASERTVEVSYRFRRGGLDVTVNGEPLGSSTSGELRLLVAAPDQVDLEVNGVRRAFAVHRVAGVAYVDSALGSTALTETPRFIDPAAARHAGSLLAPMPGSVVRVLAEVGTPVTAGQPLLVLEAMKMEHTVAAPGAGVLTELNVAEKEQVDTGQVLAVVTEHEAES